MKKFCILITSLVSLLQIALALPCGMTVNTDYKHVDCGGSAADTVAAVPVNGRAPYTYSWSNSTTDSIAIYSGGFSFSVTVTDANNCTAVSSGTFTGDPYVYSTSVLYMHYCANPALGDFVIDGKGGTPPYTYSVLGVGTDTTGYFPGLTTGTYIFTVTDSLGCTPPYGDTIIVPANSMANDNFTTQTEPITCATANDGRVIITTVNAPDGPFKYGIGDLYSTDSILYDVAAGMHTIFVSNDSGGCLPFNVTVDSSTNACTGCSAHFTLYPDTIPEHYYALNQATGTGPLTYWWNWDDFYDSLSTGPTPSHIYHDSAYYNICLTIEDSTGCSSTYCDSSTYIRSGQGLMIYINAVTQLPTGSGIIEVADGTPSISIYPNPASNQLIIEATNFQPQWISIYDMNGRKLSGQKFTRQLDVSALAAGLYFVEVKNEIVVMRSKFVKL